MSYSRRLFNPDWYDPPRGYARRNRDYQSLLSQIDLEGESRSLRERLNVLRLEQLIEILRKHRKNPHYRVPHAA